MPSRKSPPLRATLPSDEELLQHLNQAQLKKQGKIGKREIARELGLSPPEKKALKTRLKALEEAGKIEKHKRGFRKPDALPPVVEAKIIDQNRDGDLLARPLEWDKTQGDTPRILIPFARANAAKGKSYARPPTASGVGDTVLVRVVPQGGRGYTHTGRVVKSLNETVEAAPRMLGIVRMLENGALRLVPISKKGRGEELSLQTPPEGAEMSAKDGDLVAVEMLRGVGRIGLKQARIKEKLGSITSEKAVSMIAIHDHGIPYIFPDSVLEEAAKAKLPSQPKREDWRHLPLVTIDPFDAKDHDDAVHAALDEAENNSGGFILTIAIADVAAYVTPQSALDKEAIKRGNSVYFPDRVVPMLPERISNDLCSLREGEDRPAMAVQITIDKDGNKKSHRFHRILMRSAAKLSYEKAQAAIDGQQLNGKPHDVAPEILERVLRPLWQAYAALKIAREKRQPLDLDLPERKILLNSDGTVKGISVPQRLDAHRLIEEFMILANVAAAEALGAKRAPLLYRLHDAPSLEKLESLREFLETIGLVLPKQGNLRPVLFNRILKAVQDTPNAGLVNEVILRSQAQAEYGPDNIGHFGLNLRDYAHFTSPIRRYADLVVHRALIRALGLGMDGAPDYAFDELRKLGKEISVAERRAMTAERDTKDRLIAGYLSEKIGAIFPAKISGVTKAGLFVRLDETGADGFVPASTLGRDYYVYDQITHSLTGERTGECFNLGLSVEVKLMEALPFAGALRFEVQSEGTSQPRRNSRARMHKRTSRDPSKGSIHKQMRKY